jgi:hypothetical protein
MFLNCGINSAIQLSGCKSCTFSMQPLWEVKEDHIEPKQKLIKNHQSERGLQFRRAKKLG